MSLQLLNDSEINGDDGSLSYAAIDSPSYAGAPGLGKKSLLKQLIVFVIVSLTFLNVYYLHDKNDKSRR